MKAQFLIYFLNNQTNIKNKKIKNQFTIRNNSLNWIKLKEINLNKYTKYIQSDGKKKKSKQIRTCKVVGRRREE